MAAHPKATRGRLSSIDTLPEWADEAKLNAFTALKERKLAQLDILDTFNAELRVAALANGVTDCPQISRSAFNRASLRASLLGGRLEEMTQLSKVLAPKLKESADDSILLLATETIKMLTMEMLSNVGEPKPDGETAQMLLALSRTLKHAVESQKISYDKGKKINDDFVEQANKAVDVVAKAKGLTRETVDAIKAQILGIEYGAKQ